MKQLTKGMIVAGALPIVLTVAACKKETPSPMPSSGVSEAAPVAEPTSEPSKPAEPKSGTHAAKTKSGK